MADLLRPFPIQGGYESATYKNTRWLHSLLEYPIKKVGLPSTRLAWDDQTQGASLQYFDTPSLYKQLGKQLSQESWARLAARGVIAPDLLLDQLALALKGAMVIGYELPDLLIDALQQLDRPYVDVVLHPYRYLTDLVFGIRTNVPEFHGVLEAYRMPESLARQRADAIRAKACWMARPIEHLPPGSILVVGQVGDDRAMVLPGGRFASLSDHVARLHQLCVDHPLVLFKPHPYAAKDGSVQYLLDQLPSLTMTDANVYHLMAQPELEGVVALNSSVLTEASAFGRWGENLIDFLYQFDVSTPPLNGRSGSLVPLDSVWTTTNFWQSLLLEAFFDRNQSTCLSEAREPNLLRRSMNADWGYGFIERIVA